MRSVIGIVARPDDPLVSQLRAALPDHELHTIASDGNRVRTPQQTADITVLVGTPNALQQVIPSCPNLQWVQSTWAGVAPLLAIPRRNYILTALKGVFGQAMSEYLLGWLLTFERNILSRAVADRWQPETETGFAMKRLGILGTGSIGAAVAKSACAMGLEVVGLNSDGRLVEPFTACYATSQRLAFAEGLDYVFSVLPATDATNDLIDAAFLARLKAGAIVVNAGRGNVVVDEALIQSVQAGHVRAAVLDVFRREPLPETHPFWHVNGIYITSHTAAPTETEAAARVFLDNLQRFEAGLPLQHVVDFAKGY